MDSTQTQPEQSAAGPPRTLGDVLYSGGSSQALVSEKNWVRLVEAVGAGDHSALHALYERTHRPVFTLMVRLTSNRESAEELTVDIFDDMCRTACRYDPSKGTVLGWSMNQARARAIDWLRLEQLQKGPQPASEGGLLIIDAPDYRDVMQFNEQSGRLRAALTLVTPEERAALEIAFFSELSYTEVAKRLKQPASAIKARIRSALRKLATSAPLDTNPCDHAELAAVHAIHALPQSQVAAVEAHLSLCWQCKRELESLRAVAHSFVAWPTDLLRPAAPLKERLAGPVSSAAPWSAPEWEDVATGISCKLLANDTEQHVESMPVRLTPGGTSPPTPR